jgi:hypothetical protein
VTDQTAADFDGCYRKCRTEQRHTMEWGGCEHADKPEPTVSMSKIYTDTDGYPSIGYDQYTVPQLARLIESAVGDPLRATAAARAIVHRNDAAPAVPAGQAPAADHTTPSRRAGLRDALRRAACEAEGFAWDSDMLEPDEYGDHADAVLAVLYREWPWLRAEAEDAGVLPTDRAGLREQIAGAVDRVFEAWQQGLGETRPQDAVTDEVLAVLPEPTDAPAAKCSAQNRNYESGPRLCIRAAQHHGDHIDEHGFHWSDTVAVYPIAPAAVSAAPEQTDNETPLVHVGWWCWRGDKQGHLATMACRSDNVPIHVPAEWADEMRAVIQRIEDGDDEASPEQPAQLRRGDQFESWLKTQRDLHRDTGYGVWTTLDNLLDQYRLHADTGTPLSEHVCEGRAVGDCECLEQPAAGAQPVCAECGHPNDAHREGDDPVTPGVCGMCETSDPDDAHHDYEPAAAQQPKEARP